MKPWSAWPAGELEEPEKKNSGTNRRLIRQRGMRHWTGSNPKKSVHFGGSLLCSYMDSNSPSRLHSPKPRLKRGDQFGGSLPFYVSEQILHSRFFLASP